MPTTMPTPPRSPKKSGNHIYNVPYRIRHPDFRPQKSRPVTAPTADGHVIKSLLLESFRLTTGEPFPYTNKSSTRATPRMIEEKPILGKLITMDLQKVYNYEIELNEDDDLRNIQIMQKLTNLRQRKFDLELNYDLVRKRQTIGQLENGARTGIYFELEDRMTQILKEDYKKQTNEDFMDGFDFFSKVIRDMLRYLCSIQAYDAATILEMFWKIVLITFDQGLTSYQNSIDQIKSSVKAGSRKVRNGAMKIIREKDDKFDTVQEGVDAELSDLNATVNEIGKVKALAERILSDRDMEIGELTGYDSRNEAVSRMVKLMGKLSSFVAETEKEKSNQMDTLENISAVMMLTKKLDVKPPIDDTEAQTNWELLDNLGKFKIGQITAASDSIFNKILSQYEVEEDLMREEDTWELCEQVLQEKMTQPNPNINLQ